MRAPVFAILAALFVSCLSAKPTVLWSVPAEVEDDPRAQEIRLVWLNDDELIAVRRGGFVGRFDCRNKKIVWERELTGIKGLAVAKSALFITLGEYPDTLLKKLDALTGGTTASWTEEKLKTLAKADSMLVSRLEWLPADGLLAVEGLEMNRSDVWMFDPAKEEFRGKVNARGYLWGSSVAGKRLVWVNQGVILWAKPGDSRATEVWDSGLGEGGDDFPVMLAHQVRADGGFAAVLDNGGWLPGARLFSRQGLHGKVVESPVTRDLDAVAIDLGHGRVWATEEKTGWFGVFDLSGKVVGETEKLLPPFCRAIAVAPSGKRAAVVDPKGTLWFIDGP